MHLESGSVLFLCFMKVSVRHQFHADNLGNVIEPRNQFRISKSGRQHQMPFSILRIKNPLHLSRKPSHVRRINTANARQNDLAAVKMAGKYAVNVPLLQPVIFQPGNRKMAEQDFVTVGVLKLPQELTLSWIRFASFQIFVRETVTVNAADTEGLAVDGDVFIFIVQDGGAGRFVESGNVCTVVLLVFQFMVAEGDVCWGDCR